MVMTQTRLASFLSPVAASSSYNQSLPCGQSTPVPTGPCTQSLPCGQVSPASTRDSRSAERRSSSPVLPQRGKHKSKKVKRAENKSQRKRDKNARAKSPQPTSLSDVINSDITPVCSDNVISNDVNDDGMSLLLLDRSLREMLASSNKRSREDADNSDVNSSDPQQRLIEVESQLVATTIALEGEQNEVTRLKAHVELLESEYSEQKSELDNLRKTSNKQEWNQTII